MSNTALKFGEPVEYRGRTAIVVSDGARMGAIESRQTGGKVDSTPALVVDLAVFNPVLGGDGKPKKVVGTSEQAALIGWVHDVPVDQVERAEDWFFTLSDDSLAALLKERERRNHEKAQAAQAQIEEQERAQTLAGVKIRPSDAVLAKAGELWKASILEAEHAGEHDEIELPKFEANPEAWKPWIERAKQAITQEQEAPKTLPRLWPDGPALDGSSKVPVQASEGLRGNLEKLGVEEVGDTNAVKRSKIEGGDAAVEA